MSKKKIIIIVVIVLLVSLTIVGSVIKSVNKKEKELPTVSYCEVQKDSLIETLSASGSFQPCEIETHLASGIVRVEKVYHEVGDLVTNGTLILELEKKEYLRQLEKAEVALVTARREVNKALITYQTEYNKSKIDLRKTKATYEKQKELFEIQAISQDELDMAHDAYIVAKQYNDTSRRKFNISLGLRQDNEPDLDKIDIDAVVERTPEVVTARIARDFAQDILDKCDIVAKKEGTITKIPFKEQNYTLEGKVLAEIQSLDDIKVIVIVDEVDIRKLHVGDKVDITTDSVLGETFEGEITDISPIVEKIGNANASYVEIKPSTFSEELLSGASCTVKITTVSKENCVCVPVSAIRTEKADVKVFYLEDLEDGTYKIHDRVVETGLSSIDNIEILSGLEEGDLVAENTADFLRDELIVVLEEEEEDQEKEDDKD